MKTCLSAAIFSFLISLIFCFLLIPLLRKCKAGQNILSYVEEHKKKGGTPTMGGIAFLAAAVLGGVLFTRKIDRAAVICLVIGLAYMAVGFLDDFLKLKHKENLGLKARQKLIFQTLIALFAGIYCLRAGLTALYIPFWNITVNIGWGVLPLSVFLFLATVNAVNLTDGLDGLAAGVSLPFFAFLGGIILLQGGEFMPNNPQPTAILCFCLAGSLVAYLLFNSPPASVFMGDTGSLALGGFASAIAIFTGNALYIALLGICFVFSVISVAAQVIYYKATGGKRIFLMAPVHHHFQKKGHSESKISYAYFALTLCVGGISLLTLLS